MQNVKKTTTKDMTVMKVERFNLLWKKRPVHTICQVCHRLRFFSPRDLKNTPEALKLVNGHAARDTSIATALFQKCSVLFQCSEAKDILKQKRIFF